MKNAMLSALFFVLLILLQSVLPVAWAGDNQWTSIGPEGGTVSTLVVDPANPATLYAVANGGIFKSTNGGGSWSLTNVGLSAMPASILLIDPSNPSTQYAGTHSNGLFKSTDGGGSWNPSNSGLPSSWWVDALVIDPSNPATLYAVNSYSYGVYKSTDGGGSWKPFNTGLTSTYSANSLVIDPSNPATLYMFADVGLFKYTKAPDPNAECLFNWAEKQYSSLFVPSGSTSAFWNVYTYRHYPTTNAYLGVSSVDNHVYYQVLRTALI